MLSLCSQPVHRASPKIPTPSPAKSIPFRLASRAPSLACCSYTVALYSDRLPMPSSWYSISVAEEDGRNTGRTWTEGGERRQAGPAPAPGWLHPALAGLSIVRRSARARYCAGAIGSQQRVKLHLSLGPTEQSEQKFKQFVLRLSLTVFAQHGHFLLLRRLLHQHQACAHGLLGPEREG